MVRCMREFFLRYKLPTPKYWKRIGNLLLLSGTISAAGFAVLYNFYPEIEFLKLLAAVSATIAAVSKALSENTVDWSKVNKDNYSKNGNTGYVDK